MEKGDRQALRRYSPEEDRFILMNWWDPRRRKMVCEKLGRPPDGVNFRYYSLLRKLKKDPAAHKAEMILQERADSEKLPVTVAGPQEQRVVNGAARELGSGYYQPAAQPPQEGTVCVVPGDLYAEVEALKKLWEVSHKELQEHREAFGAWLVSMGEAYRKGIRVVDVTRLVEENAQLREELTRLQSLLERKEAYYNDIVRKLDFWLGQFMRLSSVQKIASLEDFVPRLKAIVDKWGVVTNAEVELPAATALGGEDKPTP